MGGNGGIDEALEPEKPWVMGLGEKGLERPFPVFKTEKISKKGTKGQGYTESPSGPVAKKPSAPVSKPARPEYSQQLLRLPVGSRAGPPGEDQVEEIHLFHAPAPYFGSHGVGPEDLSDQRGSNPSEWSLQIKSDT